MNKEKMTEDEKVVKRSNETQRKKIYRQKLKERMSSSIMSSSQSSVDLVTPQVKGKIIKRVKQGLRGSVNLKIEILKTINDELLQEKGSSVMSRTSNLQGDTVRKVIDFYLDDEISRTSPNSKDSITVIIAGVKKKEPVKHLMYPIKEVFGMFRDENPLVEISLSMFFKLRPLNVLSFTKFPHNICCCQVHENLRCALKSLKKSDEHFFNLTTDNNMHRNFICDGDKEECFMNNCDT
jgi:hypothetical protein